MNLRLIALALLTLLSTACGPKAEQPFFATARLINHTETEVSYAISLNGKSLPDLTLKSKEGILFCSTSPSLTSITANMKGAHGGKVEFHSTDMQLDTISNGENGLSPQGSFSSNRHCTLETARTSKDPAWREIGAPEIRTIDIQILTEK
jgi:hypothetical protein